MTIRRKADSCGVKKLHPEQQRDLVVCERLSWLKDTMAYVDRGVGCRSESPVVHTVEQTRINFRADQVRYHHAVRCFSRRGGSDTPLA